MKIKNKYQWILRNDTITRNRIVLIVHPRYGAQNYKRNERHREHPLYYIHSTVCLYLIIINFISRIILSYALLYKVNAWHNKHFVMYCDNNQLNHTKLYLWLVLFSFLLFFVIIVYPLIYQFNIRLHFCVLH